MSMDDNGKIDPPDCDTHEGLLQRVRIIENTVNEHTSLLQGIGVIIIDIIKALKSI